MVKYIFSPFGGYLHVRANRVWIERKSESENNFVSMQRLVKFKFGCEYEQM